MPTQPAAIYRRQNDTASPIEDTLRDDDGAAVDISGYQAVEIHIWEQTDGSTVVDDDTNGNVTVTDAGAGEVKYDFQSADLTDATAKRYEWQVTFANGTIETFPNFADGVPLLVTEEGG